MTSPFLQALHDRTWPLVMGIVNVTPDSFADGGRLTSVQAARDHALALVAQGADVLDIGGESTRPGAEPVSEAEELERVIPVIEAVRARTAAPISIDTRKPAVARAAVAAGADCWNDVTALTDAADSLSTAVDLAVPVILMHMRGVPQTMQAAPEYRDVTGDVLNHLVARFGAAVGAGLPASHILIDPGIGFGKTVAHNLTLLSDLKRFVALGRPVLLGASRKRFIAGLDGGDPDADRRLGGSVAAALWGASQGVALVRVHDVHDTVQALKVWRAIKAVG
jgi:dihydropteroate synthase